MERKSIAVTGMSCGGCEQNVESALQNVDGVTQVEADHEAGTVEFVTEEEVTAADFEAAVEQAGYDVVG